MKRDYALDFAKTACVIGMIIHHSLDYFPTDYISIRYFRFISCAFLFMAGFVSTNVYFSKYKTLRDRKRITSRLLARGMKLIAICVIANIVIDFLI